MSTRAAPYCRLIGLQYGTVSNAGRIWAKQVLRGTVVQGSRRHSTQYRFKKVPYTQIAVKHPRNRECPRSGHGKKRTSSRNSARRSTWQAGSPARCLAQHAVTLGARSSRVGAGRHTVLILTSQGARRTATTARDEYKSSALMALLAQQNKLTFAQRHPESFSHRATLSGWISA